MLIQYEFKPKMTCVVSINNVIEHIGTIVLNGKNQISSLERVLDKSLIFVEL